MPLLGPGSGRPGTAKPWDAPAYLGVGKGSRCFCIGAVTLLWCLAGGYRIAAAIRVLVIVKSSDDPGKVCIPTREPPGGERANLVSSERVRENLPLCVWMWGDESDGSFPPGIRRTKRKPRGLRVNSSLGSALWESPSPHTHTHAHTSGETSDKSNSFVMLCWMCAYCIQ